MKQAKALSLICILLVSGSLLKAQTFEKGDNVLSVGAGFGSTLGYTRGGTQTPAVSVNFERGGWEVGPGVISGGGYVGYKAMKYSSSSGGYTYTQTWNYTIVGARAAYHYTGWDTDKFDVYGGVMLSYNILSYKYKDNMGSSGGGVSGLGSYGSAAGFSGFVGGRYYFTPAIAAYSELGYGVSYLSAGISFKF